MFGIFSIISLWLNIRTYIKANKWFKDFTRIYNEEERTHRDKPRLESLTGENQEYKNHLAVLKTSPSMGKKQWKKTISDAVSHSASR